MPYINLIQEQRAQAQKNELRSRLGFFTFIGISSLAGIAYGFLTFESDALANKQSKLEYELQQLEPVVAKIAENTQLEDELKPRLTSLEEAHELTARWVQIMDHFSTQTPSNTWLTAFRAVGTDPQQPVMLTLTGLSTSQEPIGEFMLRTQNQASLDKVQLKFTNEKLTPVGRSIEFEIGAEVLGTVTAAVKEEEEAK